MLSAAAGNPGASASDASGLVFLLDVDNTLLDNDRFSRDLDARLTQALGTAGRARYRELYEQLREERGYADYLAPLQGLRREFETDPDLLRMSAFLLDYPFAERLYPRALDVIAHLRTLGTPVILSDGDIVFQPRKIQRAGLWDPLQGRVLVCLHKERMLDAVQMAYPARHYVAVDDKPALLAAIKSSLGARVTTVFVRQGHYATEADVQTLRPPPDLSFPCIGDLVGIDASRLLPTADLIPEFQ